MHTMRVDRTQKNSRLMSVRAASRSSVTGLITAASAALILSGSWAHGQEVKVGVQLPYTGVGAENARQIDRGLELYLKLNAEKVKPYTIKLIKRDAKDLGGASARIAVQELLTQQNVDILTGWYDSPSAIASAPLVTAGKKLAVILNAGTAHITNLSPYYVRVSFSNWHAGFSMGEAAARMLQAKTAVVGYSDFAGGRDSLAAFKRGFTAHGGTVIDEIPMGGTAAVPDFTPFFQRARDKKPDVFYVFVPAGDFALAAIRTYHALGMRAAGIKLIGPGEISQDSKLQAMGEAAVGLITAYHYNADLGNAENQHFVAAWKKEYGADAVPDFFAIGGYDGMAAIVHAIHATNDKSDANKTLAALRGWTHDSPRGPMTIDPATRDVIMNEYLSEVVMQDGRLRQKVIGTIERVKDPCKELKIGPCRIP
ncbi:MAG: ABC transporter substrate-binding protein [Rhizobiales bacterium]|nr:ABC transporter substrate-binding protein [Hyphomicrobiales bacterium]